MLPEHLQNELEESFKKYKPSDKQKQQISKRIEAMYEEAKIAPGEAIGIITAESFGEPSTQMTISSFHFAGVAEMNVTVGLVRLIEIFDARKKPSTPRMELPLKAKYAKTIEMVKEVSLKIKETKLADIVSEININVAKATIEVELDKKKIRELDIKPSHVLTRLKDSFKTLEVRELKEGISLKAKDQIKLSELYKLKEKAKTIHIAGLKGVTQVLPIKDEDGYIIHTAGSNLKDALKMEEIDKTHITSNDIFEIADVFGIEAARKAIINESLKVIKDQGLDIDIRHVMFLSDVMTRSGTIKGVTRTGITGEKESVLARASFETPMKHIINASLIGERDDLNSVVENVILNQPVPLGTGLPGVVTKGSKK
ncbi:MAG: DNA-directed RNA polymerase subunit A'' [Candidatus Nanoarchaeia archaeon]